MNEIWKNVKDYPNYEVSNLGKVRNKRTKYQLSPQELNGYIRYQLWYNGGRKFKFAHVLVAEAFINNPENKPEVNHKSGDKKDNSVQNLEWCTKSENCKHRDNVLHKHGGGRSKKCHCIETGDIFYSYTEAANFFGCERHTISNAIKNNKPIKGFHLENLKN